MQLRACCAAGAPATSHTLLQAIAFFPQQAWDAKATLARWTMVMNKALLCHMRAHSSLRTEVAPVLGKTEMQLLLASDNAVLMTLQVCDSILGKLTSVYQKLQPALVHNVSRERSEKECAM